MGKPAIIQIEYGVFECPECHHRWPNYLPEHNDPWIACPQCSGLMSMLLYPLARVESISVLLLDLGLRVFEWVPFLPTPPGFVLALLPM